MNILVLLHTITLILLPLYIIRFSLFNLPFTLLEVSLLLSVISSVVYGIRKRISIRSLRTFFDLPLLFLLIAALLSLLITPDLRGGLGIFRAYFLEPVLFFYSIVFVGRNVKNINFILYGLISSVLIVAILGFIQRVTGQFIFAEHEWVQGRISAFYNSANSVALFLGPIIPIVTVLFFETKKKLQKYIYLFLLLFLSLIMFWTKSKGGILTELVALGLVVFGLLCQRIHFFKKVWYLVPVTFLLLAVLFFFQVFQFYNPLIQKPNSRIEDDTLQIRYATWFSTTRILNGEAILGTGLNGFKYVYDQYKLPDFQEDFQYPHTIVFNFWTEIGLLGLVSFFTLLAYCFFVCIELNRKKLHLLSLGLIGSFACIIVHGLVDVPYFKNDLAVQFWVLVGLTQLLRDQIKERI